jgi:hypothetical protein
VDALRSGGHAEAVGRAKDYWKRALDRLRKILEA